MKTLTASEIEGVQRATETILEDVGVRVQHEGLLRRARQAGARVDDASGVVRLPAPLLRELLATAPAQYAIADALGGEFTVGEGEPGCLAIVTDPWIVDYETGRPRRPRLADLRRHSAIAQQLQPVIAVSRMDYPVADVEGPHSSLRALQEHLTYFAKHYYSLPTSVAAFEQWVEIARILAQGRTLAQTRMVTVGVPILSPLTLTEMNATLLQRACELNFPIVPTTCPMAGTTGPYDKLGTLVLGNAENVFMAALVQILRPGHPFLYALGPSRTDMRSGGDMYYTLDKVLWKRWATQMGKSYSLPTSAECGGSMGYRYDPQSGAEGMLFMQAAYESGADVLAGIGSCYNAIGMSAEMMVLQVAWLEAARFLERSLDSEALERSVDSIRRVGPGGHFLTDALTIERLRAGEFFDHPLFDHSGEGTHHPGMVERAHQWVEDLVGRARSPLPDCVREDLDRYFDEQYRKSG
ncbi:MAG: trimethylamine methyltransferase family protein [Anaerolineae bacterium]|nr:trimethylamine methyltransferase family protein [Anaerolineae bacterium]